MSSVHETAYPRFKTDLTEQELRDIYTPTSSEDAFAQRHWHQRLPRLALLVLLKTTQRLGYVAKLADVPPPILKHIAEQIGLNNIQKQKLFQYDQSGVRQRLLGLVRAQLGIKPFSQGGEQLVIQTAEDAAESKQELADIINILIEELIRKRYELPGFSTLARAARRARTTVNERYYQSLYETLTTSVKSEIDDLLSVQTGGTQSSWNQLKSEPKRPTTKEVKSYLHHLKWLKTWAHQLPTIDHIPNSKWRQYVLEARSLDAAELKKTKAAKRYALVIILIHAQLRRAMDDTVEVFIRKVRGLHTKAEERLQQYHLERTQRVEKLIGQFRDVLEALQTGKNDRTRIAGITAALKEAPEHILAECDAHMAYAGNNYYPFLLPLYKMQRPLFFNCLELIKVKSTTNDQSLIRAIHLILENRNSHKEMLSLVGEGSARRNQISLHWIPEKWRKLVAGKKALDSSTHEINRKYFELCVFTQVMKELKSGDLYVEESEHYSDYRDQLIDWETFESQISEYGEMVELPTQPQAFVDNLKRQLTDTAHTIYSQYPDNEYLDMTGDGIVIRKHTKVNQPDALAFVDQQITEQLPATNILDLLVNAEGWLDLHRQFGPLSGFEAKVDDPRKRFITTLFCYGCNLGPTQTARSVKGLSRKQVAWLNLRHITEERLEKAIVQVINAYNKFLLPKYWGSGKSASADGTKWNLYEQNLLTEYHIRYGGYGGIGYYHVSDMYIALFSHFIPCGVYEAIYILDGLIKNESDIQPDTIHGDTQAQSVPVFGLAYLLGINLMPRIRGLKKLVFYKPDKTTRYEHINKLFSESINWQLIETHLPDMLRIVLSIKAGKITPSTILRRLGSYSRKNKLYFAFRELGRAVRTIFLLNYIGDVKLRKTIQSATNKSEEFNNFAKWLFFGGEGIIAENIRHEQRKVIKYNQLVANLVILHNVEAMTRLLKVLQKDGHPIDAEILAGLSPYRTNHINRLGDYTLNLNREIRPMDYKIKII